MFKKINLAPLLFTLLSACATDPAQMSATDFAKSALLQPVFNGQEVVGEKIKMPSSSVAAGIVRSNAFVALQIPAKSDYHMQSMIGMDITYFDNGVNYVTASVADQVLPLQQRKVVTRTCTDFCSFNQVVTFALDSATVIKAADSGLEYTLHSEDNFRSLKFKIPAVYIQGLLKAAQSPVVKTNEQVVTAAVKSKSTEMTQYWFAQATTQEQELFTEWAFKNRKTVTSPLNGQGKTLEMLAYWYAKATSSERSDLLSWIIAQ